MTYTFYKKCFGGITYNSIARWSISFSTGPNTIENDEQKRNTEAEIDAAAQALAATVGESFKFDKKGIRRVEPNLLDPRVAKGIGITAEVRQAFLAWLSCSHRRIWLEVFPAVKRRAIIIHPSGVRMVCVKIVRAGGAFTAAFGPT